MQANPERPKSKVHQPRGDVPNQWYEKRGQVTWSFQHKRLDIWAAVSALILFGHAIVLALEFLLMRVINRHAQVSKPSVHQVLRAWLHESLLAVVVFAWRQPFCASRFPDLGPGSRLDQRGVVLIHGYACNRGIWNLWLSRLRLMKVPALAVNLEPPWAAIEDYARQIEAAVSSMRSATGHAPVVVAHSMGGLAARRWMSAGPSNPARISALLTLGTPHQGTWLARFALGRNGSQMRPGSSFLLDLAAGESAALRSRITCLYSNCDNIMFPTQTAALPGARNQFIEACAHVQLVDHPASWAALLSLLTLNSPAQRPHQEPSN